MDTLMGYVWAFIVGGIICVIAQVLIDKTKLTPPRILVSYVVAGVILGGLGLYESLVKFAGGGATTPLTGFGYTIAKGVRQAVDSEGIIGALKGALTATAGGITAALFFGLAAALVFKSKPKR